MSELTAIKPFVPGASVTEEEAPEEYGDVARGAYGAAENMQAMLYGAAEAAGEAVGNQDLIDYAKEGRLRNLKEAMQYGSKKPLFDSESMDDVFTWFATTAGQGAVNVAPGIAGAGAGAAVGSAFSPAGTILGAAIGGFFPSFILGAGETQLAVKERDEETAAPGIVFAAGGAIGALDTILPGMLGTRMAKAFGLDPTDALAEEIVKETLTQTAKRIAAETGKGASLEGLTEAIQETVVEFASAFATDQEVDTRALTQAILEAAATGFVTGGGTTMGMEVLNTLSKARTDTAVIEGSNTYDQRHREAVTAGEALRNPQHTVTAMTEHQRSVDKRRAVIEAQLKDVDEQLGITDTEDYLAATSTNIAQETQATLGAVEERVDQPEYTPRPVAYDPRRTPEQRTTHPNEGTLMGGDQLLQLRRQSLVQQWEQVIAEGAQAREGVSNSLTIAELKKQSAVRAEKNNILPDEQFAHDFPYLHRKVEEDMKLMPMQQETRPETTGMGRNDLPMEHPSQAAEGKISELVAAKKSVLRYLKKQGLSQQEAAEHPATMRIDGEIKQQTQVMAQHMHDRVNNLDRIAFDTVVNGTEFAKQGKYDDIEPSAADWFTSGRARAEALDHPVFQALIDKVNSAMKRADAIAKWLLFEPEDNTAGRPGSHASGNGAMSLLKNLHEKELAAVTRFVFVMDKAGHQYQMKKDSGVPDHMNPRPEASDALMDRYGLSAAGKQAARKVTTVLQQLHDSYNQVARTVDPLHVDTRDAQPLWMMRMHLNATYKVAVTDPTTGMPVAYLPAMNKMHAKKIAKDVKKALQEQATPAQKAAGITNKVEVTGPLEYRYSPHQAVEAMVNNLRAAGKDGTAQTLLRVSQANAGFHVHKLARVDSDPIGFEGSDTAGLGRPKTDYRLATEFIEAFEMMVRGMSSMTQRIATNAELHKVKDPKGPYMQHYPVLSRRVLNYERNAYGEPSYGTSWTRSVVGKIFGNNMLGEKIINALNVFSVRKNLASPGFIMAMTGQPIQIGLPKLTELKYTKGYKGSISVAIARSVKDIIAPGAEAKEFAHFAEKVGLTSPNFVNDFERGGAMTTQQDNVITKGFGRKYRNKSARQRAQLLLEDIFDTLTLNKPIQKMEEYTRLFNGLMNYHFLRDSGLSKEAAMTHSEGITGRVMVEYTRSEKMPLLQEFGPHAEPGTVTGDVGNILNFMHMSRAISPFKSFVGNWLGHLVTYTTQAKRGVQTGKYSMTVPFATFMLMNLTFAGLSGMLGIALIDDTIEKVNKLMGWEWPTFHQLAVTLDEDGQPIIPEWVATGLPSSATGVDLSGTFAMPGLDPNFDLFGMAGVDVASGALSVGMEYVLDIAGKSDPGGKAAAWKEIAPKTMHGAIEAYYMKQQYGRAPSNSDNRLITVLTENPVLRGRGKKGVYERTEHDWIVRIVTGKKSVEEADAVRRAVAFAQARKAQGNDRRQNSHQGAIYYLDTGKFPEWWAELPFHEQKSLAKSTLRAAYKMTLSEVERQMPKKMTSPQTEAFLKYLYKQ